MKRHRFAVTVACLTAIILSFVACDDSFATLETDVINSDIATNFDILRDSIDVITYTQSATPAPVQTDGLETMALGTYEDIYGTTTASILSQLTLSSIAPDFSDLTELDSVVFFMPHFIRTIEVDANGDLSYEIDSVFGLGSLSQIKLSLYESNYFLRDFDPNGDFDTPQAYYSNKTGSTLSEDLSGSLMGTPIDFIRGDGTSYPDGNADNVVNISDRGFALTNEDDDPNTLTEVIEQETPGIRVKLDKTYWLNKIIGTDTNPIDATNLSTQDNFNDYFRGMYIKAELPPSGQQTYAILNPANITSNITIYYKRFTPNTSDEPDVTENATYTLGFGPTRVNFFDNNFLIQPTTPNPTTGDARLYLKGGEGYSARIKLFDGDDVGIDANNDGINRFEEWKNQFVETNADGEIVFKRLINEANLVFHVNRDIMTDRDQDPERVQIYDAQNHIVLLDYIIDATNTSLPNQSKTTHTVPLNNGDTYKVRITNHINNLLRNDSTNVELGLSVSLNVNTENPVQNFTQRRLQDTNPEEQVPMSSVMSPRGTILHGNNSPVESKRVYLEVFYTCLNTDEDCFLETN